MSSPDVDLVAYDPMAPAVQQDPFPYYAALRARSPVHRLDTGVYCISRMSTVRQVLARPEVFSSEASNAATRVRDPAEMKQLIAILEEGYPPRDTLLTCDPPTQTRYRQTVGKAFSARRVQALEPRIRAAADAMIDAWPAKGRVDFMHRFAVGFPVRVIAELLGMGPAREADIKRWSDDSVAALGVDLQGERRLAAARGVVELQHYWADRFERARTSPGDDLVSDLAHAEFQEADGTRRGLSMAELLSIIQQLMVAGNETTTKVLNETLKLLLENDGEWDAIRSDPSRIPSVVEEALRLATPNQGMFRQVREDVTLEGVEVPAGSTLWLIFGSANRDESVFPEPDRFDPTRPNLKEHLAFGQGAHFCIGAPLARLELRVALEQLSQRLREIRLADDNTFEYEPSYILRGLSALTLDVARADA